MENNCAATPQPEELEKDMQYHKDRADTLRDLATVLDQLKDVDYCIFNAHEPGFLFSIDAIKPSMRTSIHLVASTASVLMTLRTIKATLLVKRDSLENLLQETRRP